EDVRGRGPEQRDQERHRGRNHRQRPDLRSALRKRRFRGPHGGLHLRRDGTGRHRQGRARSDDGDHERMLPHGRDSRSQTGTAPRGSSHHVQHRALPSHLRPKSRPADFPDAGINCFAQRAQRAQREAKKGSWHDGGSWRIRANLGGFSLRSLRSLREIQEGFELNWRRLFSRKPGAQLTPELRARILTSFDEAAGDEEHFPSTIDPRIYHVKLIHDHLGNLAGRRVLDVGCGKGRFARVFQEQEPRAELWGLDISEEMLRYVPAGIHTRAGAMTELPFEDGFFDGAYATESLEHAVEIEKAVSEICRVVKHGGRQHTAEWEKGFAGKDLERVLRRDCRGVSGRLVSYWEDVEADGLFLAG